MTKRLIIKNGQVTGFADEIRFPGLDVVQQETKRVSKIIPENKALSVGFQIIRCIFSDESKISGWTRKWKCNWLVVIDGQRFGSFTDRNKAIQFEKQKIYEQGKFN